MNLIKIKLQHNSLKKMNDLKIITFNLFAHFNWFICFMSKCTNMSDKPEWRHDICESH